MADTGGIAAERLRSFIERVERLEEDRTNLNADIREVYAEAKSAGFDVKTMRQIVRLRKMEPNERTEPDRKSVVEGKGVPGRLDLGGSRIPKHKKKDSI